MCDFSKTHLYDILDVGRTKGRSDKSFGKVWNYTLDTKKIQNLNCFGFIIDYSKK